MSHNITFSAISFGEGLSVTVSFSRSTLTWLKYIKKPLEEGRPRSFPGKRGGRSQHRSPALQSRQQNAPPGGSAAPPTAAGSLPRLSFPHGEVHCMKSQAPQAGSCALVASGQPSIQGGSRYQDPSPGRPSICSGFISKAL